MAWGLTLQPRMISLLQEPSLDYLCKGPFFQVRFWDSMWMYGLRGPYRRSSSVSSSCFIHSRGLLGCCYTSWTSQHSECLPHTQVQRADAEVQGRCHLQRPISLRGRSRGEGCEAQAALTEQGRLVEGGGTTSFLV